MIRKIKLIDIKSTKTSKGKINYRNSNIIQPNICGNSLLLKERTDQTVKWSEQKLMGWNKRNENEKVECFWFYISEGIK